MEGTRAPSPAPTTAAAPRVAVATRRLAYVDTLRGFAALWVFLLHQPVLLLTAGIGRFAQWGVGLTTLVAVTVAGTATALAAAVLHRFIEKPFLVRGSMRSVVRSGG